MDTTPTFKLDHRADSAMTAKILAEVSKVIVGQADMLEGVLIGLLTGGHILLEGVPGLAKTLTISTFAQCVSLAFQRIQFTPDLLPTDLIGTMIFNPKSGEFVPKKGPVFSNIILADEINRAPAKVQSALLEAMAEKQVTIGDDTYPLPRPFLVMATQNPLEQEGTYPLPEAQLDRFMFKILVDYPTKSDELEILEKMAIENSIEIGPVLNLDDIIHLKRKVESIYVDAKIKSYIVEIVMATRKPAEFGLRELEGLISVGGSPRATLNLVRAAKAHAFIANREFVSVEDVKAVAFNVLRHRILLSYEAEAEELDTDEVIKGVLNQIEVS